MSDDVRLSSPPALYLASQSPRRRELLAQIGVQFEVVQVNVPEIPLAGELPEDYVARLAMSKATAGLEVCAPVSCVLGSDTVVVANGAILEKPHNKSHFLQMISRLSGAAHQVITAVALVCASNRLHCLSSTQVYFREICEGEAIAYWDSGEPRDKAGGYGIQGLGAVFVEKIEGSYSNVVGLPLFETSELLRQFNIPVWQRVDE